MYLDKAAQSRSNWMNKLLNLSSYQTKTYELLKKQKAKNDKTFELKRKESVINLKSNKEN